MKKRNNISYILIIICLLFLLFTKSNKYLNRISSNIINTKSKYDNKILNEENKELKREIKELKNINKIDYLLSDKKVINASVIYRSAPYWHNYIIINKGKKDNIKKGYAVINNDGLIGEVEIVYKHTSKVRLITNKSNNYISAKFTYNNKDYYGIIRDYNIKSDYLYLENVIGDLDKDIINNNVVTSGLSSSIPSGLLIGKIIDLKKDKYNLSNIIKVKMSSNINDLKFIKVVGKK